VVLKSPQGREVILHDKAGDGRDDLVKTFRSASEPGLLGALIGTPAKGDWQLQIADTAKDDTGALTKWGIAVTY
jgi:subtilisin-like proprotein convertase family protein